ncbi:MAG: hypothetical protein MI799_12885 [Desulfobacterales bacterium]|nr:hypothetical protein [Desulfobacterales bacterium]
MKAFLPFFQTLLGGLLTLMGLYFVQRRSDQREKDKLFRETVQEIFVLLLSVESNYVQECINFHKGVRDNDIERLRVSEYGSKAAASSDKAIALLELYFPFMDELVENFCEVEAELMNFHSHVIDSFNDIKLATFDSNNELLSDKIAEAIMNIKYQLSELMQKKIDF